MNRLVMLQAFRFIYLAGSPAIMSKSFFRAMVAMNSLAVTAVMSLISWRPFYSEITSSNT